MKGMEASQGSALHEGSDRTQGETLGSGGIKGNSQ